MSFSTKQSSIRVLAVGRSDAQAAPGGGEIQMASTIASMGPLGVNARAWHPNDGDFSEADCLHLFGSLAEHVPLVEAAKSRGMPVVLSTIAWFDWVDYWRDGSTPAARVAAVTRFAARAACPWLPSWRRRLYHSVDRLLPNSTAEADQLIRHFGVSPKRIHVVPNGAYPRFAECDGQPFVDRHGVENFVLCPGRIEPRKNQLGLIRAMRDSGVPLVILGQVVPGHESYLQACRREADENVHFIDRIEHNDPLLGSAYAACGCLALASWFETPGLAALEASMLGVPLVLPEGGCAREYFGRFAQYVKPNDYRAIRRAVTASLDQGRNRELAEHARDNFTWSHVAAATREAYEAVVMPEGEIEVLKKDRSLFQTESTHRALSDDRKKGLPPGRHPRGTVPFFGQSPRKGHHRTTEKGDSPQAERGQSPNTNPTRLRRRTLGQYRYVRVRWRIMFAAIDFFGRLIFGLGRWAKRKTPCEKDPRTILLIQLDHLGDAVLSTGMIDVLRRRYPNASLEVLTSEWNEKLFRAIDGIDRIHVSRLNRFSRAGRLGWPLAIFGWGWRLRRRRIDLGIDVRGEFPLALMLWLAGAKRRLGWSAGGGDFFLTDSPRFVPNRPEIESRAALLAELGLAVERSGELTPVFHPSENACLAVRQWLDEKGVQKRFVAVHVSAGTTAKQWPIEHWRTLVGRLVVEHGLEVVLVGGRSDRIIAQAILEDKTWPGVHDWTGQGDVVELAALLREAELVVGADSGPVHLAAAVGRPMVVLFSGTNCPEQWQPRGPAVCVLRHPVACSPCHREQCPRPDHPCMNQLLPEPVVETIMTILNENRETPSHDRSVARIESSAARAIAAVRSA